MEQCTEAITNNLPLSLFEESIENRFLSINVTRETDGSIVITKRIKPVTSIEPFTPEEYRAYVLNDIEYCLKFISKRRNVSFAEASCLIVKATKKI